MPQAFFSWNLRLRKGIQKGIAKKMANLRASVRWLEMLFPMNGMFYPSAKRVSASASIAPASCWMTYVALPVDMMVATVADDLSDRGSRDECESRGDHLRTRDQSREDEGLRRPLDRRRQLRAPLVSRRCFA